MNSQRSSPPIEPGTFTILVLLFVYLHFIVGDPSQLLSPKFGMVLLPGENQIMVQDFSNLYHYVRGVFLQTSETPYRISEMNQMLTDWTGGTSGFMPFLSPPTILLTFGPLSLFSSGIAYTFWMLASFIGAAWTVSASRKLLLHEKWWPFILGWLSYGNLTCMMAINLGQTVFLTNTALFSIFLLSRSPSRMTTWGIALLLLLLTGKPQVSLVAVFYLLAEKRWKELILASVGCFILCLSVTPLFGNSWPLDYLHSMSLYGSETAPIEIRETIGTTIMTNFRAVCVEWHLLHDTTAVRINWLLFLGSGGGLFLLKHFLPHLPKALTFALSCMIYLLWSPHLNPHEDFLLLLALYATLSILPQRNKIHWYGAVVVLLLGLQLNMDMNVGFTEILRPFHTVFWIKALFTTYLTFLIWKAYSDKSFFLQRQTTEQEKSLP